ncbi:MAG: hypothetical protein ACE5IG_01655 [Dehalococcoidia bacterium]
MKRFLTLAFTLVLLWVLLPRGTLGLSPVEELASPYRFQLVQWEVANFPGKWLYKVRDLLPGGHRDRGVRLEEVRQFFHLGREIRRMEDELRRAVARSGTASSSEVRQLEETLQPLQARQASLGARIEEVLEGEMTTALAQEGLTSRVGTLFPPVDFAFDRPPSVLVVSPRDRIESLEQVLLRPGMAVAETESLEETILKGHDLAALVVGTGGLSTYPSVIPATYDLEGVLVAALHEWLHQFFYFRPLGRNYARSLEMTTLNETMADLASQELADVVYQAITGQPRARDSASGSPAQGEEEGFDFDREMRRTRLRVDELLAQGRVEEAERYMEERRRLFVEQGYYIRKLNQAYFAFHGTYADSPASVSPIHGELEELRALSPSVGEFIRTVARFSSYQEFQAYLAQARQAPRVERHSLSPEPSRFPLFLQRVSLYEGSPGR